MTATPEDSTAPRGKGVQTLDRAVAILDCFTADRQELGLSEIARSTGLTTSTAHRLLVSLQFHGLVRRVPDRRYTLGPHLLRLARAAHPGVDLQVVALPVMRRLRNATGETVGLHVLSGHCRLVVDQVESREPLRRTYTELEERIPLHQGAPGKVLLAFLPAEEREAVLAGPLEAATPATITDPGLLRTELDKINRQGHAFSFEERVVGIRTVAVPIRNHAGAVRASVSVTGPALRVTPQRLKELAPLSVRAGAEISANLGWHDGT
ncbi:MAG: IclR family transcriptional regulator [Actinomycetota bacterium]|nr:IclR family transcriptional regulator [Actinomycetota bacterium]